MPPRTEEPSNLIKRATQANATEFLDLTRAVVNLMSKEKDGLGNLQITGKLIKVPPEIKAIVVGDLHGDLESLSQILKGSRIIEKLNLSERPILIFLGDYGDRGIYSPEVYYVVLTLKENYPESVVLIRGNHEGPDDLLAYPHDLPDHLRFRFGEDWPGVYEELRQLFVQMYTAVLVEDRYILLHGGVPSQAKSLDDIAYAHEKHPRESHLEEILWSDPEEGLKGTCSSPRGAGRLFGEDVTHSFLNMLNVRVLIRGHEPSDAGFKVNHKGRILTLFSRRGEPYYNAQGAYLHLDLAQKVESAYELRANVRTF